MSYPDFDQSGTAWISKGFEQLASAYASAPFIFDVLIVGSGYGGSIAADTLSQHTKPNGGRLKICLLERGKEYLPGSFPANSTELPAHIRFGRNKLGLFDFRVGQDVVALVANGVGGGSLINAGVMKRPLASVLRQRWPAPLSDIGDLEACFDRAELLLGSKYYDAGNNAVSNVIERDLQNAPLKKLDALRALRSNAVSPAPVTVAEDDRTNSGCVRLSRCRRCGDCATGCNHNAKDSLDTNLLYRAYRRGVEIYSGATVREVTQEANLETWRVTTVFTDSRLRALHEVPIILRARHVILAAGTLGSTEILKRSSAAGLLCSASLGRNCSTNGDTLITHFAANDEANAVGRESQAPQDRRVGSTINGILDLRTESDPDLSGLLIEEMASPASLRRLFGEIYTTVNTLHRLGDRDRTTHEKGFPDDDIYELKDDHVDHSALYAVMGDDGAKGQIELAEGLDGDGSARIRWRGIANSELFDRQMRAFRKLEVTGGYVIPNPLWQLLPKEFALLTEVPRGPVVTVHPLGGCVMADNVTEGVVDHTGRVFSRANEQAVYDGLAVLDGSIIPTALGVNPALTIAAVALRAAFALGSRWGYPLEPGAWRPGSAAAWDQTLDEENEAWLNANGHPLMPAVRPRFRTVDAGFESAETMLRITERMSGPVTLRDDLGIQKDWLIELTLRFDAKSLRQLAQPSRGAENAVLRVQTSTADPVVKSMLRIFDPNEYEKATRLPLPPRDLEELLNERSAFRSSIANGTLTIFQRQQSRPLHRILRSGWAWLRNDGFRDLYYALSGGGRRSSGVGWRQLVRGFLALASRAGECRTLGYQLALTDPVPEVICGNSDDRLGVTGEKRFTYGRCSNPWNQLANMSLTRFPGLADGRGKRVLSVDLPFFARIRVPLIEITAQNDGVTALAELGSFLAYLGRMVVGIHGWNFRAPDAAPEDVPLPERLPGPLPGIAHPETYSLYLGKEKPYWTHAPDDDPHAAVPTWVRLTRYPNRASRQPPLVMLHGYSASGTTFAHPAVEDNFAAWFHARQRDVWVVDFRTSCGMPTARQPWSFEQVAYRDIPEAVDYICSFTGKPQVDVIAHCMGAAMFSMAILHQQPSGGADYTALRNLAPRIRRAAFTQVSPLMVLSPVNIFRGYVAQVFREMLPDRYEFNPGTDDTPQDQLFDRLLSTLPYSEEEYRREHPVLPCKRRPWTRTRHRMDALYGRAFNTRHMDDEVLRHIDDFFGPLSLDTVTQTTNFARYNMITDVNGRNLFVSRDTLAKRWGHIRLLTVNARDNGLADYRTRYRTEAIFRDAGRSCRGELIEDAGHQDCLIGRQPRAQTLAKIEEFLDADDGTLEPVRPPRDDFVAYTPWIGPVVTREPDDKFTVRVGTRPTHRMAEGVLLLRVSVAGGVVHRHDGSRFHDTDLGRQYLLENAYFFTGDGLRYDHWCKFRLPPDEQGDAWLVLTIFNDSEMLRESNQGAYRMLDRTFAGVRYFAQMNENWRFSVLQMVGMNTPADELALRIPDLIRAGILLPLEQAEAIVKPAVRLLSHQPPAPPSAAPPAASGPEPNIVVLRPAPQPAPTGKRSDNRVTFEARPAPRSKPPPVAPDAVLDRLTDENYDLRDGLIPDLPQLNEDTCEFSLASCQYPGGLLDGAVAYTAYRKASKRVETGGWAGAPDIVPRFGVFTGDQIYADASAGLFDPSVKTGRFELPYHSWLRFPCVRSFLRQVPSFMLPDDHEIVDNWEPVPANKANDDLMTAGRDGYRKYQRGEDQSPHFRFSMDGFSFWMADSRTGRGLRRADLWDSAALFDTQTMSSIESWLVQLGQQDPDRPKFLVSPAMLLPRHREPAQWNAGESSLRSDGWDGYPATLFRMLQLLVDSNSRHVIFLSGDEHMPAFARATVKRRSDNREVSLYSIHTAAAYAPFPFANGGSLAQIPQETIYFTVTANSLQYTSDRTSNVPINPGNYDYQCRIGAQYPQPGDALTYVRVRKNGTAWTMRCEFAKNVIEVPDLDGSVAIMQVRASP
jgi:cholesterol oxidase